MDKVSLGGRHSIGFCDVVSIKNLFRAWRKFKKGKSSRPEIAKFELQLEENLFSLHEELISDKWKPDPYITFRIADPKPRVIHKASVRDRVLFQALYQALYQVFDDSFIYDSYSSRNGKGTHLGVRRLGIFAKKTSRNWSVNAFVLKCDIRKFFDNVDHHILLSLLAKKIQDRKLLHLLEKIIKSFETAQGKGLPLGNVTSQIFANIYLNELDQFVKHELKAKYYIRYADDFVILDDKSKILVQYLRRLVSFLRTRIKLEMHPKKVFMRKLFTGTDFLGYVILPHRDILRTGTKKKMLKRLSFLAPDIKNEKDFLAIRPIIQSYFGMLSHCKSERIKNIIRKLFPILQRR